MNKKTIKKRVKKVKVDEPKCSCCGKPATIKDYRSRSGLLSKYLSCDACFFKTDAYYFSGPRLQVSR